MEQNIQIAVRIKPSPAPNISPLYYWDSFSIQISQKNIFSFDSVIDSSASQQSVFEKIGLKIISNVLDGYNGCIFAYGQTGSGKTYTMTGIQGVDGVVQKSLKTLWNCVRKSEFYEITLGYFQIYNQTIKDLLSQKQNLTIRQNAKTGFYIENLTEKIIQKYQDFQALINRGISMRTIKETKMNQQSSRSHSVLEINVTYKTKQKQQLLSVLKRSKLTFIDLAGSQKQKETQVEGQRLKEAANINKSLSTLSLVISKLSEQSQRKSGSSQPSFHVPFRNSVLTKILKNTLTGRSKIIVICTVSLEEKYIDETISTFRFAQTAKSIKMKVSKNQEEFDGSKERLFQQFKEFKAKYDELKEANLTINCQNEELKGQNARLKDQIEKQASEINELQISLECMKMQSQQIIQDIRVQSQLTQSYGINQQKYHPRSQFLSVSERKERWPNNASSSQELIQPIQRPNGISKNAISHSNDYFNRNPEYFHLSQTNQKIASSFSQLSFFKTHFSSEHNSSPRKSFFTIPEEYSKQQNQNSLSKSKIFCKMKQFQNQISQLRIQNQFLKFNIDLNEQDISTMTKKMVFTELSEQQIEKANSLFNQLVENKQFSFAQLKFLDLCLKNTQKDKIIRELVQQSEKKTRMKCRQTLEKIKKLMADYFQTERFSSQLFNINNSQLLKSPSKEQSKTQPFCPFLQENADIYPVDQENQQKYQEKNYPKIFNKKISGSVSQFQIQKGNQAPFNFRQQSQNPIITQSSRFIRQPNTLIFSQMGTFFQDSRSMISQATNNLSNNELEYLRNQMKKITLEVKVLKSQVDKNKILMMQKETEIEEKQQQVDQLLDQYKRVEQALETSKNLLQIEREKHQDINSKTKKVFEAKISAKQKQLEHFKIYLNEIQTKKQIELNSLNLQIKSNQIAINNHLLTIDTLKNQINQQIDHYSQQIAKLNQTLDNYKKEKQQNNVQIGLLNSQNALITERYNRLKEIFKNHNQIETPKKKFSKRSSFYSLTQSEETPQGLNNRHSCQSILMHRNSISKPKQLTEKECLQVIQNKTSESMYQAAYYFYLKSLNLQSAKQRLTENCFSKTKKLQNQLIDSRKQSLKHQSNILQLKNQRLQRDQAIFELQKTLDRVQKYCQLLEIKLKQKDQKELEAKQNVHNLSTQLRQNFLTPNYSNKNRITNLVGSILNQSNDSLVTNGDTPNIMTEISNGSIRMSSNSRKSLEIARIKNCVFEDFQTLHREIQQLPKQQNKNQSKKVFSVTESVFSQTRTITNDQIEENKNKNRNLVGLKNQNILNKEVLCNRSKVASTKSHFQTNSNKFINLANSKK